ncbi:LUD domain-containing protein [Cytophagaceae bacterium ABcell3]|nr:LUD domain-containing protein [Cytophagaceae bacterium ABcell3]
MSQSREIILKKVKDALADRSKNSGSVPRRNKEVFSKTGEKDLSVLFAENFIKNMGEFVFTESDDEFLSSFKALQFKKNLRHTYVFEPELARLFESRGIDIHTEEHGFMESVEASVTTCEALVARTGSIFLSSANKSGRRLSVYPPAHIVVARTSQIVYDISDGISYLKNKYKGGLPSMLSLTTGPSRTADIEKTLVLGAHGPKELIVFLIDDTATY